MASGKMALTKKSAPCPETILVVTTTKLEFSLHVACVVDRKFRVNDVGKLPCSCRGWTAARLWYMAMQPDKVSGGRLLEEDDGISIGACRSMVCRRIATSVWNPRIGKTFTSGKKKKVAVECKQSYYLNAMSCQENQGSVTTTLYYIHLINIYPLLGCGLQS